MRIKWGIVDCNKYELKIIQILTYVQNMSTMRSTSVKYEIEIVAIITIKLLTSHDQMDLF